MKQLNGLRPVMESYRAQRLITHLEVSRKLVSEAINHPLGSDTRHEMQQAGIAHATKAVWIVTHWRFGPDVNATLNVAVNRAAHRMKRQALRPELHTLRQLEDSFRRIARRLSAF